MDSTATILFLLLAVVVSSSLARLTRLPLPLVQIALGALIALSVVPTVVLDPQLFFLLFLIYESMAAPGFVPHHRSPWGHGLRSREHPYFFRRSHPPRGGLHRDGRAAFPRRRSRGDA